MRFLHAYIYVFSIFGQNAGTVSSNILSAISSSSLLHLYFSFGTKIKMSINLYSCWCPRVSTSSYLFKFAFEFKLNLVILLFSSRVPLFCYFYCLLFIFLFCPYVILFDLPMFSFTFLRSCHIFILKFLSNRLSRSYFCRLHFYFIYLFPFRMYQVSWFFIIVYI